MGCCGGNNESEKGEEKGIVQERSCRDVLCLVFFILFWVGMVVVCSTAVSKGNYKRLVYGYDSQGFLCGTKNDFIDGEEGPDFTQKKKLYYLNALELLNPLNFKAARSVCVEECPTLDESCGISNICTDATQFRCPYYRVADENLYGTLGGNVDPWETSYYTQLETTNTTGCGEMVTGIPTPVLSAFGLADDNSTACGEFYQVRSLYPNRGPCHQVYTDTVEYFNRCFPKFTDEMKQMLMTQLNVNNNTNQDWSAAVSTLKDEFGSSGERLQRYVGDITKGWLIIVIAGLVSAVTLAMIWMIILRYFAGVMAWMTVVLVNLLFIALTIFAFERSGLLGKAGEVGKMIAEQIPDDQDPTEGDRKIWTYAAIGLAVVTGLLLLLTILMIKRIKIAVAVIKVASQAISTMPSLLFFPVFPFILEVALVIYFVFVSALLYSAGDLVPQYKTGDDSINLNQLLGTSGAVPDALTPEPAPTVPVPANITREECAKDPNCYYEVSWDNNLKYMFLYHLFGMLWTNQFIVGFGYVVIAGSVANFYWSRGDSSKMSMAPVCGSIKRAMRYHLGSIALGSFIVAVIQFIRIILEYVDRKTKKLQEKTHAGIKYIVACIKCFMWCLEKIMKFINRNAYIMVAVKGSNFCVSAGRAVALLVQNALRLAAVNIVGDILIWLGKLAVTAGAGCIAFLMTDLDYYTNEEKYPDTFLSSPLMPVLVSLLVGYVVADLFFEVYEMAVDTILLSFCEDCEQNDTPRFAPPLLMEAIGKAKEYQNINNKQ